jgi:hypothetical protein
MGLSRLLIIAVSLTLLPRLSAMALEAQEPSYFNGFNVENGLIAPVEIDHGGPGRDGVPALDDPVFLSGAARAAQITGNDRIMGVSYNGVAKAYPIKILDWHEIVNDTFGDTKLTISFCPLCGSGMVFLATVDGQQLNFGVSGLIYNSDLLLYDRNTESLWSQLMKTAVTGPLAGSKLTQVPAQYTTWSAWLEKYPDSLLLSRDTGHTRDYHNGGYLQYRRLPAIAFPTNHADMRLTTKDWVVGITVGNAALALPFAQLDRLEGPLAVTVGDAELEIHWDREAAAAQTFERGSGREIATTSAYWFAWVAFHPETALYEGEPAPAMTSPAARGSAQP